MYLEKCDNCIFEIPAIVTGTPIFDCEKAAKMIKKEIRKEGLVCKILYTNQLYISWNVSEIEKMKNIKIKFRTDEEKRKQEKKEHTLIQKEKYRTFKNPETVKMDEINSESESEIQQENSDSDSEKETNFDDYFNMDINSNPSRVDEYYPEAASFYKYYPPNDNDRIKHSDGYTSNTKTFFPVEYTDPPQISKVKFGNEKRRKKVKGLNKFNKFLNPEKSKSVKTVNFTQGYTSNSSELSKNTDILNNLESLKKQVNKLKIKR